MSVFDVLVVDDHVGDVTLIREALRESSPQVVIHHVHDGRDALAYLVKARDIQKNPIPHLILCDMNMPRMSGLDVLRSIRGNISWKAIPLIMMSSSTNQKIVEECIQLGISHFFMKPDSLLGYRELCHTVTTIMASIPPAQHFSPLEIMK